MRRFTKDKDQHPAGPSHTSIPNGSYRCPSGHATRAPSESGQPTTQEDCVECNQIRTQLHQVQAEMAINVFVQAFLRMRYLKVLAWVPAVNSTQVDVFPGFKASC
ncbi:hypothetical protein HYQ44_019143 [Verticillium longisporum]|nr:hypothetical protein HYQ44_019143 [Verticillium longisporum]